MSESDFQKTRWRSMPCWVACKASTLTTELNVFPNKGKKARNKQKVKMFAK